MSRLESEFVKQAFDSNYIAHLGPMVDAFEQEFAEKVGNSLCGGCILWDSCNALVE